MKPPHGLAEIKAVYGDIRIARLNGKMQIVSPVDWEYRNCLVVRDLPMLDGRPLYINRAIEKPLRDALTDAFYACPGYKIMTIGCFNPRAKRVDPDELSLHSWAVALDINAATNPMKRPLTTDMPKPFVEAFKLHGFTHGGDFSTPDPMHFQLASGY